MVLKCGALKICHKFEVFFRKYLRNMLRVNKSTSNCMIYGETGATELELIVNQRMVAFWCRLLCGRKSKLSYIMYSLNRKMHYDAGNAFTSPWIEKLEKIFSDAGMNNIWLNEGDGFSDSYIKKIIKTQNGGHI